MATKHFLKHGNGVHYCSVSLAVAKKVSVAVLFHMNFGPRAKPKVEDGKCGRAASHICQNVLITSAGLGNCANFVN